MNPPTPPAPVTVNDVYSSLLGVGYDYDYLFNFADDNAIGSASATLNVRGERLAGQVAWAVSMRAAVCSV